MYVFCLKQSSKHCLKTFLSQSVSQSVCGLSVKENGVSDSILWNFIRQNATNVYCTKKKLPLKNSIPVLYHWK